VANGECTACHTPHASSRPSLLAGNPRDLCLQCHDGLRDEANKAVSKHKPVMDGLCATCHTAHGGDAKGFPRGKVQDLCLSCHRDKKGNHPSANHPTSDRIIKATGKPLTCLSCHEPHFSTNPKLLAVTGCDACHK
jgi:predicted CXXCH cytochrome family protein